MFIYETQILSEEYPIVRVPVLHAFQLTGLRDELMIIYCGTGLSLRTLHWVVNSGDGIKEYGSKTFSYIESPRCTGADSVQAYVDHLKE